MARPCPPQLARALLDNGAHIDAVNGEGETFCGLLRGQRAHELVNVARYETLRCAAARAVKRFKIPYRGVVPAALEGFIACH